MEFTPKELQSILTGIANCGDRKEQPFKTDMINNFSVIQDKLKERYKGQYKSEKWSEFEDEQRLIADMYILDRNKDGSPNFGDNELNFNKELTELKIKFKPTFKEKIKADRAFEDKVMNKAISVDLNLLSKDEIPSDLTISQYLGISPIIKKD